MVLRTSDINYLKEMEVDAFRRLFLLRFHESICSSSYSLMPGHSVKLWETSLVIG
ncbi:hypothetical protein HanIR_Chr13g0631151 [Helianthus annuus]|nr:hypothetical protein HanIR_Chr13g0631151 [Helianthus annuus]